MNDEDFKMDLVTGKGSLYSLLYCPLRMYYFSSKGTTPIELMGSFTCRLEALTQFNTYDRRLTASEEVVRVKVTEDVVLADLTTKVELLSYAEHYNIEIPEALSNPKQIKKLLQTSLAERS